MKKITFLLLSAAMVAFVGCKGNDPQDPKKTDEADFVVKFYTCDSLLQYVTWTLKDTCNPTLDCSKATIAKADTLGADKNDWQEITDMIALMSGLGSCSLNYDNIKIITFSTRLKPGTHVFQLTYTYNGTPFKSAEIDVLNGGSFHSTTSKYASHSSYSANVSLGLDTNNLTTFLGILNNKVIKVQF